MANMALVAHVYGRFLAGPSYEFPTMIFCQASRAGVGLFDLLLPKTMHVGPDAKVTVSLTGDAMAWTFDWNPPDPVTGIQGIRIRVFDTVASGPVDPDEIRITIERLDRV
jgi:hypothetical protein